MFDKAVENVSYWLNADSDMVAHEIRRQLDFMDNGLTSVMYLRSLSMNSNISGRPIQSDTGANVINSVLSYYAGIHKGLVMSGDWMPYSDILNATTKKPSIQSDIVYIPKNIPYYLTLKVDRSIVFTDQYLLPNYGRFISNNDKKLFIWSNWSKNAHSEFSGDNFYSRFAMSNPAMPYMNVIEREFIESNIENGFLLSNLYSTPEFLELAFSSFELKDKFLRPSKKFIEQNGMVFGKQPMLPYGFDFMLAKLMIVPNVNPLNLW